MQAPASRTHIAQLSSKIAFRVQGVPPHATVGDLRQAFSGIAPGTEINGTICVSCNDDRTQVAIIMFKPVAPVCLESVLLGKQNGYQCELYFNDKSHELDVDINFRGLTQLYKTKETKITADIIAVTGLAGHALGSWRGRGVLGKHWLRDYLQSDLENCRTMIYGYDSTLDSMGVHQIEDYYRGLTAELMKVRKKQEEMDRPIIFIGHSFGGIIISQYIVSIILHDPNVYALYKAARLALFFGTPHRGFNVDNILSMINKDTGRDRMELVRSLEPGSKVLEVGLRRFRDVANQSRLEVATFYETMKTQSPVQHGNVHRRTGEFKHTVNREAAMTGVDGESSIPIDADHSCLVKFDSKSDKAYGSVRDIIRKFEDTIVLANEEMQFIDESSTMKPVSIQNINTWTRRGYTSLHAAVGRGEVRTVKRLLDQGADPNIASHDSDTPLGTAASKGYSVIVSLLIEYGAYPMAANATGATPLHRAALQGMISAARVLLEVGRVDVSAEDKRQRTPLHEAAYRGHTDIVQLLIDDNANVTWRDWEGDTPLQDAVISGWIDIVKIILRTHRSQELCSARNDEEDTPLHQAAGLGFVEIVQLLLQSGANVNALNKYGWTPLHCATGSDQYNTTQVLLNANAAANRRDRNGRMPVHIAARSGYLDITQLLLRFHDNILATHPGGSILHDAVRGENPQLLNYLLLGMIPTFRCRDGYTPLHLAANCYPESVAVLLQHPIDIDAQGPMGRTALHWAAAHGDNWTINELLKGGASIYFQDDQGNTPYDVARGEGNWKVVQMLNPHHATYSRENTSMDQLLGNFSRFGM